MSQPTQYPTPEIAAAVVAAMTAEQIVSADRMPTGDQNYVFEVKSTSSEYVIRMTGVAYKMKFIAAIYWQELLLPLGVPLAKFIKTDLDQQYSPFPSLLMKRLAGDDLINVYPSLSNEKKKNLAIEMTKIQALLKPLPCASFYGYADSYDHPTQYNTWYDFLLERFSFCQKIIAEKSIFNLDSVNKVLLIMQQMEPDLKAIAATPFLWDASERNVMIHQDRITGIVDVDELCFGDPLFVIALTAIALECEGHDALYTDYWAETLQLDANANKRLILYKLFYIVAFMRKHAMDSANSKKVIFNVDKLNAMLNTYLKVYDDI